MLRSTRSALSLWLLGLAACLLPMRAAWAAPGDPFMAKLARIYGQLPNIQACRPGVLTDSERQRALDVVNRIRSLHGLAPVEYATHLQSSVMQAALMMSANADLNHEPPPSWKCYSKAGAEAAGQSNLAGGQGDLDVDVYDSENEIIGWLTDEGAPDVGHRRWLIDPFLTQVAYGRVSGVRNGNEVSSGGAMRHVVPEVGQARMRQDFVAYPHGNYPRRFFPRNDVLLSFSAVPNASDAYANQQVDFSSAQVSVVERGSRKPLRVSELHHDNDGYGVPNVLTFKLDGLRDNVPYDVSIRGVKVSGQRRDYTYGFSLVP